MAIANRDKSHRARRVAKQLEREVLRSKLNRSFTRTTENFSEAIAIARANMAEKRAIEEAHVIECALPKVAHMVVERGRTKLSTVLAIMAHYKEETGAVPVLHLRSARTESIHIPSCLGVWGNSIGSSAA